MSADLIGYAPLLTETRSARSVPAVGVLVAAGGLRVPLTDDPRHEIVDLIADAAGAALVVARSGLATLNHTARTVETLRSGRSTLPASR